MISVQNLSKQFNEIIALSNINLTLQKGQVTGILGPNGAGKTTLFKIICQLLAPTSGTVTIDSTKKKAIGAIIEKPGLYEYLSAMENLKVFQISSGLKHNRKEMENLLEKVKLPLSRKDPVRNFSLGMKQRLAIAASLINDPDILILDEPFLGLDPPAIKDLRKLIEELSNENGKSILVSSHQLEELSKVCDSLIVLKSGKIVKTGTVAQILEETSNVFLIKGSELNQSKTLIGLSSQYSENEALIKISYQQSPEVLAKIIAEGARVVSFTSQLNLETLYDSAD